MASTAVSGAMSAGSEITWDTVDADGKRLARNVAKNLGQLFVNQGWIPPGAVN